MEHREGVEQTHTQKKRNETLHGPQAPPPCVSWWGSRETTSGERPHLFGAANKRRLCL